MKLVLLIAVLLTVGCTSVEERDAHMRGQIEIVKVQKDAEAMQKTAEANAKAKLYEALAAVAMANPDQASAVTVALAVQGVGQEAEAGDTRIVPLQPLQNESLEYAKVFAAPLMNMTTAVATAYINADVAKTQSNNAAAVQINDSLQDSRIVEAVAGVGMAAAQNSGLSVNGDNYTLSDSASISQDQVSNVAETTTTTTTTTETNTSSEIADSYNTVTYEGQDFSLPNLLAYLQGTGLAYNLTIGDTVYTVDGDGDPVTIDCGAPDFSPSPPECI